MKDEFKDIDFRSEELKLSDANRFTFRAGFKECQLQYASFHGLSLLGTRFDRCLLEEVDFTDCNLKKAVFNNRLCHAKFSRYGVEGLLAAYKIEIV